MQFYSYKRAYSNCGMIKKKWLWNWNPRGTNLYLILELNFVLFHFQQRKRTVKCYMFEFFEKSYKINWQRKFFLALSRLTISTTLGIFILVQVSMIQGIVIIPFLHRSQTSLPLYS